MYGQKKTINHYLTEDGRNLVVTHLKDGKDLMGLWAVEKRLVNTVVRDVND